MKIWFTTTSYSQGSRSFFELLFQLFCPGKAVDEVEPVPLHPADGAACAAEQFGVAVVQVGQVAPQLFPLWRVHRPAPCGRVRVCNESAPYHDAGQGGELFFQRVEMGCGATSPL